MVWCLSIVRARCHVCSLALHRCGSAGALCAADDRAGLCCLPACLQVQQSAPHKFGAMGLTTSSLLELD